MTEERLRELCVEWQETLYLQDWTVSVFLKRAHDFSLSQCDGECYWQLSNKRAKIHILDPVDYPPNEWYEQDQEKTLVHELLHLHFAPFAAADKTSEDTAQEQAIDLLSRALVELKRRGGSHEG